jgi:hypothetical protein
MVGQGNLETEECCLGPAQARRLMVRLMMKLMGELIPQAHT